MDENGEDTAGSPPTAPRPTLRGPFQARNEPVASGTARPEDVLWHSGGNQGPATPRPPRLVAVPSGAGDEVFAGSRGATPARPGRRGPGVRVAITLVAELVVAAGLFVGIDATTSAPSLQGATPQHILQAALAAARAASSFEMSGSEPGSALASAEQQVEAYFGPGGATFSSTDAGQQVSLDEIGGALYMRANDALWGAAPELGGVAAQLAGKLIEIPPSVLGFDGKPPELLPEDVLSSLVALAGPYSTAPASATPAGTVAIVGTLPDTALNKGSGAGDAATLVVSATPPYFPLRVSFTDPGQATGTIAFNHWGVRQKLPSTAGAVSWAQVLALLRKVAPPAGSLQPPGPVPVGTVPPGSVTPVVETADGSGAAVDVSEAETVGRLLWEGRRTALHYRDPKALALVESGPALAVDRVVCEAGCPGPPLYALGGLTVAVPKQPSWPAEFLATASYDAATCPDHPCDDTFVAVQQQSGAPWTIALVTSFSGPPLRPDPAQGPLGYIQGGVPGVRPADYLAQYAAYLQSIKTTGNPPATSWLVSGAFTTGSYAPTYVAPSSYAAQGVTDRVDYSVGTTPAYIFMTDQGYVVCGTVDWTDTRIALKGRDIVQSPDFLEFGPTLPAGTYRTVVMHGIHMDCFIFTMPDVQQALVLGDDHGTVQATGS